MNHVRESIRQIDSQSWLISETLLLRHMQAPSSCSASWSDGKGGFFVLSNSSGLLPSETQPLSDTGVIQKVYDAGDVSAVWRVGEAFVKVKDLGTPDATREHNTLQYVRNKQPLSFRIPHVYYHTDLGPSRYLIVISRVAGQTLNELWYDMNEPLRQECIRRVARICTELAAWKGKAISGVDGKHLTEYYFARAEGGYDFSSDNLLKNCKEIGMDCSSFVFYHCDLGPGNILYDASDGSISIIDWETAGYVPKEWICTKFRCSSGHDLPEKAGTDVEQVDWRRRVGRELIGLEFYDIVDEWLDWRTRSD
ncbi:kinase-like domain-containing protein [Xylaria bambusicola]|uniref:kinase-like domain-containing protein n=1 Tax=Xylaria bambusicola TaxID=326684 RepID=UPI00200727D4|nr:kinase-like domain-containing protein [Xylaria bambusicola]KAI0518403.1 kinase-like domain-containing protein [Xylaria bambusicola]